jgi:SlyX protein
MSEAPFDWPARVQELEMKLGFAEDLLDDLNRSVFRQQEQIDSLQRQLVELHRMMQSQSSEGPGDVRDEIPPHY